MPTIFIHILLKKYSTSG